MTKSIIPPCPHCGQEDYVYRTGKARGVAREYFDLDGTSSSIEADQDSWFEFSKTLRCGWCKKKRTDVVLGDDYKIVPIEGQGV